MRQGDLAKETWPNTQGRICTFWNTHRVCAFELRLWNENTAVVTTLCTQNVQECSALVPDEVSGYAALRQAGGKTRSVGPHLLYQIHPADTTLTAPIHRPAASTGNPDARACEYPFHQGHHLLARLRHLSCLMTAMMHHVRNGGAFAHVGQALKRPSLYIYCYNESSLRYKQGRVMNHLCHRKGMPAHSRQAVSHQHRNDNRFLPLPLMPFDAI